MARDSKRSNKKVKARRDTKRTKKRTDSVLARDAKAKRGARKSGYLRTLAANADAPDIRDPNYAYMAQPDGTVSAEPLGSIGSPTNPEPFAGIQIVAVAAARSTIVVGDQGGDGGSVTGVAGTSSEVTVFGTDGLAYVLGGDATCNGSRGIAITRGGGDAIAADIAAAYQGRNATATDAGIAIAVNNSKDPPFTATAQAGYGGAIALGYIVDDANGMPQTLFKVAEIDNKKYLASDRYYLSDDYQITAAEPK